jgi:DNA-binding NarL/FixJ family response regulator
MVSFVIRVLVIDDHPVVRTGLEALLRSEPGFVCVGTVPTRDACPHVRRTRPDVVLGTRGPLIAGEDAVAIVDDASDLPRLFDRLRLAARGESEASSSPAA